jgi:hypothetical protein
VMASHLGAAMLWVAKRVEQAMSARVDVLKCFTFILGVWSGQVRRSSNCEASATMAVR